MRYSILSLLFVCLVLIACDKDETASPLLLESIYINSESVNLDGSLVSGVTITPIIRLTFSEAIDEATIISGVQLWNNQQEIGLNHSLSSDNKTVSITPVNKLKTSTEYLLRINDELKSIGGRSFENQELRFRTVHGEIKLQSIIINGTDVINENMITDVPLTLEIRLQFSEPVNRSSFQNALLITGNNVPDLSFVYSDNDQTIQVTCAAELRYLSKYDFKLQKSLESVDGAIFGGYATQLFTALDTSDKFPRVSEEELLTLVQQQTFKYFWDFGHPVSGLSRERNTSGNTVASGASGFGLMTIPVGIERGFITRSEGIERLSIMINFLGDHAERFHGVWSHWLNGETGKAIAFSEKDNGGDLVETSFVAMGLTTVRQYLNEGNEEEKILIDKINSILTGIEWDWYRQGNKNILYWHWSPDHAWEMNHPVKGWNEALITYVMASTSTTHSIPKEVYTEGWKSGQYSNGRQFYDITLPLGPDYGGSLFFEQYTFLGLDPRNLKGDAGEVYWQQVVNHTLINREHCVRNPNNHLGYSANCWGLTASDNHQGYSAHSPSNDLGVITPTAALSSFPFTPEQSKAALEHFYYQLGDRVWGPYGFYDAFNVQEEWYATSNIGIDQGPILLMIENHRSGLLWNLFMSAPEVKQGLDNLGFTY